MQAREGIPALGAFVLVSALGFDEGGYAATAWGWSAAAVLAVLAFLLARGAGRPAPLALVFTAALAALTAWALASTLWSRDVTASVLEVERLFLYLAASSVFVLARSGRALLAGGLGGATLLCGYGLARWLLGDPEIPLSADPLAAERLSEPIGYANGVAALAAMGLLLSLGFAARAGRVPAAVAAIPGPLLAATLYFTFSRGAWLALFVGLAVAVVVGPHRLQLATTASALAAGSLAAVIAAHSLGASGILAPVVVVLCAASAGSILAVRAIRLEPPRWARIAFAATLIGIPVVLAAAVLVRLGGPDGAYDAFKAAPSPVHAGGGSRVLSASGSSRADYWRVAWRTYEDEPLLGAGAGAFARSWLKERPIPQPVRDAHNLYLETLAELGPLGLLLLGVALAAPFAARRSRWTPAAVGPYAAYLAHAAQDWDWELPAITILALACGAAQFVPRGSHRLARASAVAPVILCGLVVFAYAGNRVLSTAVVRADRGEGAARGPARTARTLQPWSAEPWRVLGEAHLALAEDDAARRSFRRGLELDPDSWELWLGLGLANEGPVQRAAWTRAASLNPLSPELRELGFISR